MSKLIQELVYDKVVEVLNLNTQGLKYDAGYSIVIYQNTPYVINLNSSSKFDYAREEVIPVSEEISQETPSTNKSDRGDFIFQYQILFRTQHLSKVKQSLREYRDYFINNKQHIIDDYKVAFKVTRGDKLPDIRLSNGNFWSRINFTVYLTAIKNGYIRKDIDTVKMVERTFRETEIQSSEATIGLPYEISVLGGGTNWNTFFGTTDVSYSVGDSGICVVPSGGDGKVIGGYQELILDNDVSGSSALEVFSNATAIAKGSPEATSFNGKLRIFYNSTALEKDIYKAIMNKLDKDTVFLVKYTFDLVSLDYTVYIAGGARTLTSNNVVILEFDIREKDE